jgi:hypothetical protein
LKKKPANPYMDAYRERQEADDIVIIQARAPRKNRPDVLKYCAKLRAKHRAELAKEGK